MAGNDFDSGYIQLLIGQLQGRVNALEEQNRRILNTLERVADDLDSVNRILNNATGGWRTLVGIGSAGAVLGGLLVSVIQMVRGG